jgi:uncharacterized YigZ family protein
MDSYTTIESYAQSEYEDRKSVFIAEAMPIKTEPEAIDFINGIKKKYPDARHHVYAYVLRDNSIMRYSDDGEPQATAGMPVLDVIRKNGCTDTVIVVTRYFGGTLLGTGGLVRAYTASAADAIRKANIITYEIYSFYELIFSYSDYQKINSKLLELNFKVIDTEYGENIAVAGKIKKTLEEELIKSLTELTSARAKYVKLEEKFDY